MVLKTFNVSEETYSKFSRFCKSNGISMSKQIDNFMESFLEEPVAKPEYLKKLDRIRKGRFIKVKDFAEHFGL